MVDTGSLLPMIADFSGVRSVAADTRSQASLETSSVLEGFREREPVTVDARAREATSLTVAGRFFMALRRRRRKRLSGRRTRRWRRGYGWKGRACVFPPIIGVRPYI